MHVIALIGAIGSSTLDEARALTASAPDSARIERMVQVMGSSRGEAQRLLIHTWGGSGSGYERYLGRLAQTHRDRRFFQVSKHHRALLERAAQTLGKIAMGDNPNRDLALRALAYNAGSENFRDEIPPIGGCGVGVQDRFRWASLKALSEALRKRPPLATSLLREHDVRVFAGAMEALTDSNRPLVLRTAAGRIDDKDEPIRRAAAYYLTQRPLTRPIYPDIRHFLATAKPGLLNWASSHLNAKDMALLYPGQAFGRLPTGAHRCSLDDMPETNFRPLLPRLLADPDDEVVALAAQRGRLPVTELLPLFPRLAQSRTHGFDFAMQLLPAILEESNGVEKWTRFIHSGPPEVAVAAFASLGFGGSREDALALLLSILPDLERVDGEFYAVFDLDQHWPELREVVDRMMGSSNRFVHKSAAEAICYSAKAAPTYVDRILADPNPQVQAKLLKLPERLMTEYGAKIVPALLASRSHEVVFDTLDLLARKRISGWYWRLETMAKSRDRQVAEYARTILAEIGS